MNPISFTIRPSASDWDETIGAWRCSPLAIPGANIRDAYVGGTRVDKSHYEVIRDQMMIRWVAANRPEQIAFVVDLDEELSLYSETNRWKKLSIILPVVGTILSAIIAASATYYGKLPVAAPATGVPPAVASNQGASQPPHEQTRSQDEKLEDVRVFFPRGDKICISDKNGVFKQKGATVASVLGSRGISVVDFHANVKAIYASLSGKSVDELGFVPFTLPDCELILNSGPKSDLKFSEVQVFQHESEITIDVYFKDASSSVIAPDQVGIDWNKFRQGMRVLLRQLYDNKTDFEFDGVSVLTKPGGEWSYQIGYRKV